MTLPQEDVTEIVAPADKVVDEEVVSNGEDPQPELMMETELEKDVCMETELEKDEDGDEWDKVKALLGMQNETTDFDDIDFAPGEGDDDVAVWVETNLHHASILLLGDRYMSLLTTRFSKCSFEM